MGGGGGRSRKSKKSRDGTGGDQGAQGGSGAGGPGGRGPGERRPQDKGRHIHPVETSSWQEEVKHFEYRYTKSFRVVPPYKFEFGTSIKARWISRCPVSCSLRTPARYARVMF